MSFRTNPNDQFSAEAARLERDGSVIRFAALGILLFTCVLVFRSREAILWLAASTPLLLGLAFPIFRNDGLTNKASGLAPFLSGRVSRAKSKKGKMARFVRRP